MQGKAVVGKRGGGSEVKKQSPARVIPVVTRTSPAEWQAWLGVVRERSTRPRAEGVLDSRKGDRRPHLVVNVYGQPLLGLLDSGASRTLVGGEGWRVLRGLGLRDYGGGATHVTVADGSRCVVQGCVDLPFELEGRVRVISALVVPTLTTPLILGTDFWRAMAIVPNLSQGSWEFQDHAGEVVVSDGTGLEDHLEATQRETLDGVVRGFVGRVGTPLGCTHRVQHVVDTGDSKPIKQRYYPVSPVLERAMHAELDEMLQAGVVEPSKSAWSSPVVMIRKKDGSYRFCVDYRKVNAVTRRDAYPLPYVSHILDRLRNARYLSSLDVKSAYWQVPLSEESKERTAFTVPGRGLFQFTRMPFGLHNSPATWQRLIDQVLGPELERHVFVYLDDIIVCSAQFDEHVETLDRVFKKLREAGLTLNLEKCQFCRPELRYLGYVVDRTGLRVDAQKVECIVNFPAPRTPTQVRRFLGMCGWYRRFIPDFSTVAAPLTDLLKKGRAWLWSGECERAFAQLKEHLVSAPILTCPDFERPFIVQTDASGKGIGAILSQELPDGERVVAYASRALSKAERNYSTTEQECLAVIWAVEKFRPYLEGTEFTVITDHAALKWLNGLKDPVGRLASWALRLQQHPFKVIHRPGKLHAAPDALSRDTAEVSCSAVVVTESSRDGWYQGMVKRVRKDPQQYPRWEVRDGDQLFRRIVGKSSDDPWRLVVPKPLRLVVLQECRDSHPAARLGVFRARQWIQGRCYWPGMRTDVARFVARSRACLPSKPGMGRPKGPEGIRRGEVLSHREDTVA
ncbi:hypothetical protein AAG570_008268 [Ranatra chinensis]|uniref:RNA-directed DNA polymerase n=1 Tax=Ranatra chinensis TaxID=642074 RepID=A0ABD0XSP2_9HEMI